MPQHSQSRDTKSPTANDFSLPSFHVFSAITRLTPREQLAVSQPKRTTNQSCPTEPLRRKHTTQPVPPLLSTCLATKSKAHADAHEQAGLCSRPSTRILCASMISSGPLHTAVRTKIHGAPCFSSRRTQKHRSRASCYLCNTTSPPRTTCCPFFFEPTHLDYGLLCHPYRHPSKTTAPHRHRSDSPSQ